MKTKYCEFIESTKCRNILDIWEEQSYFYLEELVSKPTYDTRLDNCIELFTREALLSLLELRVLFNNPMTINTWLWGNDSLQQRGWRSNEYNGARYSQHRFGNAFDFDVKSYNAEEARNEIIQWKREGKLSHLTSLEKNVSWIHFDCRISNHLNEDGLFIFGA